MAVQVQYNDNDYKNWVRTCLGLKFLKEGLVNHVDNEVQKFHKDILVNICGSATCNGCTTDDLTRRHRPLACPNNVCDKICDKIQNEFRYRNPQWDNTDATKWCTDYWEIAKCFMSKGSKTMTCPADTDTTGILSVCINGLFMPMSGVIIPAHRQPPLDIFHKNRNARNTILHSGSMSLSDTERQAYIQDMIDLLTTYKQPVDQVTQEAIDKLTRLNIDIFITSTDEVAALKLAQQATYTYQQNLETKIDTFQEDLGRVDSSQHDLGKTLDDMKLEQEQERTKQEEQLLKLMDDTLLRLQTNTKENISDIRTKNESLLKKNGELHKRITDLVTRIENLEKEVQDVKGKVRDVEGDVRDVKDEVLGVRCEVQDKVQDVKGEVQEVKGKLQHLDEKVQTLFGGSHVPETRNIKKDIQEYLLEKYKDLSKISMPPLLRRIKADIDYVYTELIIRDDLVHNKKKQPSKKNKDGVEDYHMIFYDTVVPDGETNVTPKQFKPFTNIYVLGAAGMGKTTWSRKLVCTWCEVISNNRRTSVSSKSKIELQKYDLVFYIELRRGRTHVQIIEMIENQLFPHQPALMAQVKTLMENSEDSARILIVLDGLDEWVSLEQSTTPDGLPARDPRWKSTVVTTTRSWKLDELQLDPQEIDHVLEIRGLRQVDANRLVRKVVTTLNTSTGKNKDVNEFRAQCRRSISQCMNIPLLLNILVCLWYEEGHIDELLSRTFCGLVELLIKHAEGDAKRGSFHKISHDTLKQTKQMWKKTSSIVPDCLAKRRLCSVYAPLLNGLGKIAFDHLFSRARESTLVFNHYSISDIISEEELQIALNIGILSQTTHCGGSVLEEEFSLSFLHKTVQEYLAALYMVYDDTQSNACLNSYQEYCTDVYKVLEMENVLTFVSGMCPEMAGKMSCHIATLERNEMVHQLLLRCVRQERMASSTSRQIYIKHHILYSSKGSHRAVLDPNCLDEDEGDDSDNKDDAYRRVNAGRSHTHHGFPLKLTRRYGDVVDADVDANADIAAAAEGIGVIGCVGGGVVDTLKCNADTVALISESNDKELTLFFNKDVDGEIMKNIADIRDVKLVEAIFYFGEKQHINLDFGEPSVQGSRVIQG